MKDSTASRFSSLPRRRPSRLAPLALLAAVAIALAASGCASLLNVFYYNAADKRFELDRPSGPSFSESARQTLRENSIRKPSDAAELARLRELVLLETTPELLRAYSEAAYLQARKVEKSRPLYSQKLYVDVVLFSWHYLFNPSLSDARDRATWTGELSDVVLLYDGACERFLHLALRDTFKQNENAAFPFSAGKIADVRTETDRVLVATQIEPGEWRPDEYGEFRLASDCVVESLGFNCRESGFGVPLVVERSDNSKTRRVEEKYYPPGILFPATAVLRPNPARPLGTLPAIDPNADAANGADFTLDLFDPISTSDFQQSGNSFPLEADLTTPLAYYLTATDKLASRVERQSLLDPEELQRTFSVAKTSEERQMQGLYLLEPYNPDKIPVVMIHGLASTPFTWMEMYNALRGVRGFRSGYQFMFFFYPTGQPFWASAATLRKEMRALRDAVDPNREAPALDDAVLIGHSMGGLIARMQVQSSGDRVWRLVSSRPVDSFDFDDDASQKIREWFFFEPSPEVKRVITIATPFRGSRFANSFTTWLADRAITTPGAVASVLAATASLYSDRSKKNGDFDPTLLTISTSVQSLDPSCPIFKVLDELPIPSDVALDNIVGVVPQLEKRVLNPKKSDGVVDFDSAHREDVEIETETPAAHTFVHTHFDTINEVRNLLSRHLALYAPPIGRGAATTRRQKVQFEESKDSPRGASPLPQEFYGPEPLSTSSTDEKLESSASQYGPVLPPEFYAPVDSNGVDATAKTPKQ